VAETIRRLVGPKVEVIDPAPAVARQLGRLLESRGLRAETSGPHHRLFTTGADATALARAFSHLVSVDAEPHRLEWAGDSVLTLADAGE
jgi:glutamate racemase